MVQKVDPFVNLNWGWSDGEDGWGAGMNENLITYSFFHNRRIQSIIANASLLPSSPVDGEAHFSTADKTVYFRADGLWYYTVPPIGMEFVLTTTNTTYRFDGNSLVVKTLDDFGVTPFGSSLLSAADAPAGRSVLGLGDVDNTSDLNKPISTATQAALDDKVDHVVGKQLSQEDYTSAEKAKLAGIAANATVNSSDVFLLSRNNHTGTQAISTITGLQTALDDKLDDSQLGAANGVAPLGADGKVPAANLPASGSYSGTWNASTNTPTITSGSGINGQFYIVSVAGSTSIDGVSTWAEGDQIRFNGTVWQRIPNTNAVTSVAGKTGTVTLVPTDVGVNIGTNVQAYDADLQAIAALAGTSGLLRKTAANTWTLDTSSFLTGNQTITLTGDVSGSGTTSIAVTLPATGITAGAYTKPVFDSKGRAISGTNPTTLSGYGITDAAPLSHVGSGGSAHALATTSVNGFFAATDKVKLNGIAAGATANSPDATLLARANHTGTQASSTISDLTEVVQDIVGAMFVAGTNTTPVYNDGAGTIAINATSGGGGSSTFLGLTDTPSAYTSHSLKAVRVNSGETGLEFVTLGSAAFSNTGDFAGSSHSHDASAIITGTIPYTRLPSTIATTDTAQTIGGLKTFSSSVTAPTFISNVAGTAYDVDGTGGSGNGTTTGIAVHDSSGWVNSAVAGTTATFRTSNARQFQIQVGTAGNSYIRALHNSTTNVWRQLWDSQNTLAIGTTAASARTALGLGTSSTLNATSSISDTTIGRVLKVGDFGVGGITPLLSSFGSILESVSVSTISAFDANAISDSPIPASTNASCHETIRRSATRGVQHFYFLSGDSNAYRRLQDGAGYGAWIKYWDSSNTLSLGTTAASARTALELVSIATSGSASDLTTGTVAAARMPALSGDVTTSAGSTVTTLSNSGVPAGTYNNSATQVRPFTVDAKGRLTAIGTAVTVTPAWASITSKPTTLSGYGITDAQSALGYTPVQQGTGIGQSSNTVKIGWAGSDLKATVDSTDLGEFAFKSFSSNASNLSSGTVAVARLPTASTSSSGIVQLGDGTGAPSSSKAATEAYVFSGLAGLGSRISNESVTRATPSQLFQSLGTVSGSVTVNGSNGTHVLATVNGNTTWTFPSPSSTEALALTLELTNGGAFTMTWPAGTRWSGGVAPTLTTSGTDILVFTKAGTNNWRGYLSSKDNK